MADPAPDPWKEHADSEAEPWAPILLLLPDGRQRLEVRLYDRRQDDHEPWMYLIGAPLWQHADGGAIEPMEFRTWVTPEVLEPIPGVDMSVVPKHRVTRDPEPAPRWGWVTRPKARGRGLIIHDHDCEHVEGGGRELGIEEALDAMLRPGAEACTSCDAVAVLVPMLQLGEGYA
ncbi:DUF6233 domain-containing protein [Streptomyces nojiriensis]|uniref:DUF6233 domain-containing protein n=1 Tax=Streptomyces nojiriensis TaxID=66374 RepID=UPI0036D7D332